jgi:nucleoid DNA-binding protein
MAKKKAAAKAASKKSGGTAFKPGKDVLNRSGVTNAVAQASGVDAKSVKAVLNSLQDVMTGSIGKKGAGTFILPGLLKITAVKVPAKPKRKGINPFTKQEQWFAAKPATVKVKVRPLKKLKDSAV